MSDAPPTITDEQAREVRREAREDKARERLSADELRYADAFGMSPAEYEAAKQARTADEFTAGIGELEQ